MARIYGEEFPERQRMSVLSDMLSIPHFSTSKGSKVRTDFLRAVAGALNVPISASDLKEDILLRCIAAAQRAAVNPGYLSRNGNGTVTNIALQAIIDGLVEHGLPGLSPASFDPDIADAEREALDELGAVVPFDTDRFGDERNRQLVRTAIREGQDNFRTALFDAYGSKCAMTGADAPAALEAAHIFPYRGPQTSVVPNGLLLRADLHRLFDRGQIAINDNTLEILVHPSLAGTHYGQFEGHRLALPRLVNQYPSPSALRYHRRWAGL